LTARILDALLRTAVDLATGLRRRPLDYEILRRGMMHDDGRGALLGLKQKCHIAIIDRFRSNCGSKRPSKSSKAHE
jgi:hypothetical protein